MALSLGSSFFVSAISGALSDRIGPRPLAIIGVLLMALGLAIASAAQTAATLFASYGLLVGIGLGLANVPAIAAVQRWFMAKRGLASGLAATGMGVGTALIPVLQELLSAFGDWRAIFLCCAVLVALVGLAGAMLLEALPEKHGMGPDGTRLSTVQATRPADGPTFGEALRSRAFKYAFLGTLLVSIPTSAPLMLLVGAAEAQGLTHHQAVALLGLIGAGSLAGRFILTAVADRVGRRITFLITCFAMGLVMFIWMLARDAWALCAFALIFGALQGGVVALLPAFTADSFGSRAIGGLVGALYASRGIALLAGLPMVSAGIAFFGTHELPVALCGLAGMLGALLLVMARPDRAAERLVAAPAAHPSVLSAT